MQVRFMSWIAVLCALVLFSSLAFGQNAQAARGGGRGARGNAPDPASVPHDPHDLNGIWNFGGLRTLSNDPPPMTPEAKKKFDANKPSYGPRAIPPALGNDPAGNCDPLGLVRLLLFPRPFEFVQVPGRVFQFLEWNHVWRTIWTDGRKLPEDPDPRWYGYSVGKWDGDTLVVDSVGFDDRTWLDQVGDPYSSEMRLQERYHRVGNTLELTMTLTDPKTYTRPWVSEKKVFNLLPNEEIREEICAPSVEQEFNRRTRDPAGGIKK